MVKTGVYVHTEKRGRSYPCIHDKYCNCHFWSSDFAHVWCLLFRTQTAAAVKCEKNETAAYSGLVLGYFLQSKGVFSLRSITDVPRQRCIFPWARFIWTYMKTAICVCCRTKQLSWDRGHREVASAPFHSKPEAFQMRQNLAYGCYGLCGTVMYCCLCAALFDGATHMNTIDSFCWPTRMRQWHPSVRKALSALARFTIMQCEHTAPKGNMPLDSGFIICCRAK